MNGVGCASLPVRALLWSVAGCLAGFWLPLTLLAEKALT